MAPVLLFKSAGGISPAAPVGSRGYVVEGKLWRCLRWCSLACIYSQYRHYSGFEDGHTKGSPQYVHMQICGLSTLMKILGCPNGPPPPSQDTMRSFVQRTGCLWMSSMAASGRGWRLSVSHCPLPHSTYHSPAYAAPMHT